MTSAMRPDTRTFGQEPSAVSAVGGSVRLVGRTSILGQDAKVLTANLCPTLKTVVAVAYVDELIRTTRVTASFVHVSVTECRVVWLVLCEGIRTIRLSGHGVLLLLRLAVTAYATKHPGRHVGDGLAGLKVCIESLQHG